MNNDNLKAVVGCGLLLLLLPLFGVTAISPLLGDEILIGLIMLGIVYGSLVRPPSDSTPDSPEAWQALVEQYQVDTGMRLEQVAPLPTYSAPAPPTAREADQYEAMYYKLRYSDNWPRTSARARAMTGGRCVLDSRHKAELVHHARYKDRRGAVAGREIPGLDVFPLCRQCHDHVAHSREHWIFDQEDPALGNANTTEFARRLIQGFHNCRPPQA